MKYRITFGRLLFELLYCPDDCIERSQGIFKINTGQVAKRIRITKSRLHAMLTWAEEFGLIEYSLKDDIAKVELRTITCERSYSEKSQSKRSIQLLKMLKKH